VDVRAVVDANRQHVALECPGDESVDQIDRVSPRDRRAERVLGNELEV
jgi:hypothetical protein